MDGGAATRQGQLWGRAAHDWAELQEPLGEPLWEAMLDAAAVGAGTRLLDAGCGAGGASILATARGAQVNGFDAAPALVGIARERVPDGDFRVGDLEALPYADETFDAVIVADVLSYLADPLAALCEVRRVCAPRGRVVVAMVCVADDGPQHALITALCALVPRSMQEQLLPPGALSLPGALDALITQAGLTVLGNSSVGCLYDYPDLEMLWKAQASSGPLQAVLRLVGPETLKEAMLHAVKPYQTGTGGVVIYQAFRSIVATPTEHHEPWEGGEMR